MHPGPLALDAPRCRWLFACTGAVLALCFALSAGTAHAATDWDGDGATDSDCAPLDPAVNPSATDKPDLSFEDTNCDGIDGSAANAVFVATGGSDAATGSKANPLQTINAGITKAAAEGKDVYVAGGTYNQVLDLADNVGVYGGYLPFSGARSNDETTVVNGSPQAALADGDTGVVLQLLTLNGATPAGAGQSSYGLRAINGSSAVLQKVTATAGNGTAGANGTNGGNGRAGANGGAGTAGGCIPDFGTPAAGGPGGSTSVLFTSGFDGGNGGAGGAFPAAPVPGSNGTGADHGNGGVAGLGTNGLSGTSGDPAPGSAAPAGASGGNAGFPATTSGNAWTGNAGANGSMGTHGSGGGGGGGGAGNTDFQSPYSNGGGGSGGGGGEGGAGGAGGTGGQPGGGSFGVFAHDSGVVLQNSTLTPGNGGDGGNGGTGGTGGARGLGGPGGGGSSCNDGDGEPDNGGAGGNGGHGQPGGAGGAGGGGTGGPSYGLYVSGSGSYASTDTTMGSGTAGVGGVKGGTTERGAAGQTAGASQNASTSSDIDGDGVADASDSCPQTPRGTDANGDGCPDRPAKLVDANGDGIPDDQQAKPGSPAPPPRVAAKLTAAFKATAASTKVTKLIASALKRGDKVKVTCKGKGCAFKSKSVKPVAGKANLLKLFKKRALAPKAVVTVWITRAGAIGQVVKFTIQKGKKPKRANLCVPVGSTKPQASC